jgi:prepilin peptidase CpaA
MELALTFPLSERSITELAALFVLVLFYAIVLVVLMPVSRPDLLYLCASLLCAVCGAVCDVRTRRIPNLLTGTSILAGLLLHLVVGGWRQMGLAALAGLIAGAVFFIFFVAGGMGGGDVKLMTAVACLAGTTPVAELLAATAIMGGVFALLLAIYRGRLRETFHNLGSLFTHHRMEGLTPHPELNLTNTHSLRLPYGLAIAAGCSITLLSRLGLR